MNCEIGRQSEGLPAPPEAGGALTLRIVITTNPRLLSVVRSAVSELATVCGFKDDQCRGITLAVDEALSNVMRHAYKNRRDQEIELSCHAGSDCLEFQFVDHGEAADRSRICARISNESATGGRGTHLIRQIMDEVCYDRVSEGNRLRLKKYLPGVKSKR